ncbi:hypothetical protein V2J09_022631 [Rumex salicifolius]
MAQGGANFVGFFKAIHPSTATTQIYRPLSFFSISHSLVRPHHPLKPRTKLHLCSLAVFNFFTASLHCRSSLFLVFDYREATASTEHQSPLFLAPKFCKLKDDKVCVLNKLWFERPSPSSPSQPFPSSMHSTFRIVVVGDIPDLVLFTGKIPSLTCYFCIYKSRDFGNENVELVRSMAKVNLPKAAILGNHDSWSTSKFSKKMKDGVQLQLESLGEEHVGYGRLDFPTLKLSVVGGRPFSCGGDKLFRKKLLKARYDMKTSLGSSADDICGKDWEGGGDLGDPDLAEAIFLLEETSNYSVPLVVFGHMHKEMVQGGSRKMISVASNNTVYLNRAIVPRVKPLDSGGSARAFTVLHLSGGRITKAVETWVSVVGDKTSMKEEHVLFSEVIKGTGSSLVESAS